MHGAYLFFFLWTIINWALCVFGYMLRAGTTRYRWLMADLTLSTVIIWGTFFGWFFFICGVGSLVSTRFRDYLDDSL